ncbi:MAG: hypothetical protein ABR514_10620, partial [Chthoniobacterales bacterium]
MNRVILTLLLTTLIIQAPEARAQSAKAAKAIITLLTGAAAAEAVSQTVGAKIDYDEARDALQKQGINTNEMAIYSLYFTLNGDVSSMMWADIFNKPDVFAIVSIEGQGNFLIPETYEEYSGQPILLNVIAKRARPGQRIVVNIYDDDSWSNRVWNT